MISSSMHISMLFLYDFYKENLYSESKKRRREVFFRDIMIKSLAEKMKGGGSIMLKYKNILVPYDGSDHAKEALAQAVALAANGDGTKLYIASVCNMVSAMSNFDQVSIAEGCLTSKLSEDLEEQCKNDLKEAVDSVPEGIPYEKLFEIGSPGPVLLNMAEEKKCDLIVMGSRGLGPLKGIFMGSVSSYIVSRGKCPVLIVK